MYSDLFLVIGLMVVGLAIPAIVGAIVDSRVPRGAAIMVMIGSGMIAIAIFQRPSGYTLREVPEVFTRVIGKYFK